MHFGLRCEKAKNTFKLMDCDITLARTGFAMLFGKTARSIADLGAARDSAKSRGDLLQLTSCVARQAVGVRPQRSLDTLDSAINLNNLCSPTNGQLSPYLLEGLVEAGI